MACKMWKYCRAETKLQSVDSVFIAKKLLFFAIFIDKDRKTMYNVSNLEKGK